MGTMRKHERQIEKIVPATQPNAVIAAAKQIDAKQGIASMRKHAGRDAGWQDRAWHLYRSIGEFRYACDWVGSMLSKALLQAVQFDTNGGQPKVLSTGPAAEAVAALFGNPDRRAEMLRLIGIHFTVAGECFLYAYDDIETGEQQWGIVASTKIGMRPTAPETMGWSVNGEPLPVPADQTLLIRLWRPDPEEPDCAMSPTKSSMSVLEELKGLSDHVMAQIDSRLASAGILLVPSEMDFPKPPPAVGENGKEIERVEVSDAEALQDVLTDVMSRSLSNRNDASAIVPIVITAPGEAIAKVQHMTFWSELDDVAIEMRNEAIRRLALGMDMPPEVLQGTAESNHWNAWQADESAIKAHTEPLLKIITTSLADGYLRPWLQATEGALSDGESVFGYSIQADTAEMRLRPNRSQEALELYDRGILSKEALVRETGFDEDDVMTDKDRAFWMVQKVASGAVQPEIVAAALKIIAPALGNSLPVDGEIVDDGEPKGTVPEPAVDRREVGELPDRKRGEQRKEIRDGIRKPADTHKPGQANEAIIAAADAMVERAIERAGNRLKSKHEHLRNLTAAGAAIYEGMSEPDIDDALHGAWDRAVLIADRYSLDPEWLVGQVDGYTRGLLRERKPHDFLSFESMMEASL